MSFNWLRDWQLRVFGNVKNGIRTLKRVQVASPVSLLTEDLEVRSMMAGDFTAALIQATEFAAANPDKSPEDVLFELATQKIAEQVNQVGEKLQSITDGLKKIPLTGDELASKLAPLVNSMLQLDLPQTKIRDYLESRGFHVDSIASTKELIDGTAQDLIVLTWNGISKLDQPITVDGQGELGPQDGIHLNLQGQLQAQPSITAQITFGLNADGDFFIQEGASLKTKLIVDGDLTGQAVIPKLTQVDAHAAAPNGQHLVDARIDVIFSDFDNIANERFYLTGDDAVSVTDLLSKDQAVDFTGLVNLQAELSVDNPLEQLPTFLTKHLNGLLPSQLTWTADVDYNIETGEFHYTVDTTSLDKVVKVLGNLDHLENALYEVMIDEVSQHNPIPESVQKLLGTNLPVIGKNLLDLLDVPEAAQFLIAPEAFRGNQVSEVQTDKSENKLDFQFKLFSPDNILKLLSGQTYDILSVDIDQTFRKDLTPITVLPETTLFSYCGLVNVTAQINLLLDMHFSFDVTMGLDSNGFYTLGDTRDASGQIVRDAADRPNIEFGGGITGQIIAEGDVLVVLDLVRITAGVGLEAFGGFNFVSPHVNDPKLRGSEILDAKNITVDAGLDLNLGLKGEVGILAMGLQADVEMQKKIELYRDSAGTLADIKDKLADFKEKLQKEADSMAFNIVKKAVEGAVQKVNDWALDNTRKATEWMTQQANAVTDFVKSQAATLNSLSSEQLIRLQSAINARLDEISKTATAQIDGLTNALNGQLDNVNKMLDGEISKLTAKLAAPLRDLINKATSEMRSLTDGIRKTMTNQIKEAQSKVTDLAKQASSRVANQTIDLVKQTQETVTNQILKGLDIAINTAMSQTQKVLEGAVKGLTDVITSQSEVILKVVGTVSELEQKVRDASINATQTSVDMSKQILQQYSDSVKSATENATRLVSDQFDAAKQSAAQELQKVKDTFGAELNKAKQAVTDAVNNASKSAGATVDQATQQVRDFADGAKNAVGQVANQARDGVQNLTRNATNEIGKIEQSIKDAAEKAAREAKEAADRAAKAAKEAAERAAREAAERAAAAKAAAEKAAREAAERAKAEAARIAAAKAAAEKAAREAAERAKAEAARIAAQKAAAAKAAAEKAAAAAAAAAKKITKKFKF